MAQAINPQTSRAEAFVFELSFHIIFRKKQACSLGVGQLLMLEKRNLSLPSLTLISTTNIYIYIYIYIY